MTKQSRDCARADRDQREALRRGAMQGWYEVMFRESKTSERRIFNLDHLAKLMAK